MNLFGIKKEQVLDIRHKVTLENTGPFNNGWRVYVIGLNGYFTAYANMHHVKLSEKELILDRWDNHFAHQLHNIMEIGVSIETEKQNWLSYSKEKVHRHYYFNGKLLSCLEENHIHAPNDGTLLASYPDGWFSKYKIRARSAIIKKGIITFYDINGRGGFEVWDLFLNDTSISIEKI
jgi:hypothetical protein